MVAMEEMHVLFTGWVRVTGRQLYSRFKISVYSGGLGLVVIREKTNGVSELRVYL